MYDVLKKVDLRGVVQRYALRDVRLAEGLVKDVEGVWKKRPSVKSNKQTEIMSDTVTALRELVTDEFICMVMMRAFDCG